MPLFLIYHPDAKFTQPQIDLIGRIRTHFANIEPRMSLDQSNGAA